MQTKKKIMSGITSIPASSAAGIYRREIVKLDTGYNKITGIEMHAINESGQTYWLASINDQSGNLIDELHMLSYKTDAGVSPDQKKKSIVAKAYGQSIYATINLPGANNANDFEINWAVHIEYDPEFKEEC